MMFVLEKQHRNAHVYTYFPCYAAEVTALLKACHSLYRCRIFIQLQTVKYSSWQHIESAGRQSRVLGVSIHTRYNITHLLINNNKPLCIHQSIHHTWISAPPPPDRCSSSAWSIPQPSRLIFPLPRQPSEEVDRVRQDMEET